MEVMGEGARGTLGPAEKPSRTEKQEEKARTPEEAKHSDKAGQNPEDAGQRPAQEVPQEPPQTSSQKAENGCGSPVEEKAAGEETETGKSTEVMAEAMGNEEDRPGQKSQDEKKLELGTLGEETPHSHPTEMEDNNVPEQEKGTEKQEEGAGLEPGCSPGACHTLLETSSEIQSGHAVPTVGSHWESCARARVCCCHMPCSFQFHDKPAQCAETKVPGFRLVPTALRQAVADGKGTEGQEREVCCMLCPAFASH
jgi:hypothetical protein